MFSAPKLAKNTEDLALVEHTALDDFWDDGADGHGQNWLGGILMETRTRFRLEYVRDDAGTQEAREQGET